MIPTANDQAARDRRPAIDVARVAALAVVVVGHLVLAVVDRGPDGAVRGTNLLTLYPDLTWLTLVAPMPVFFAAAGWANAGSDAERAASRLRPLVGTAAVVVLVWFVPATIERVVTGERGVLGDGARLATQPLWFLAAYLPLVAAGGFIARCARRPLVVAGAVLALLGAIDLARFGGDAADAWGWIGFLPAWGLPWMVGAWWRGAAPPERRVGALLATGALVVGAALVRWGGYEAALIDAMAGRRSNTTPPTLFTAVAALGQVGLTMVIAGALDRVGARRPAAVRRAGAGAVGVYMWHLTALALCSGVLALGLPFPTRLGGWWWVLRPLWWAAVLALTLVLARTTSRVVARQVARNRHPIGTWRSAAPVGVALAAVGAAAVGRRGPASVWLAAVGAGGLVGGWLLLARTQPSGRGTSAGSSARGNSN